MKSRDTTSPFCSRSPRKANHRTPVDVSLARSLDGKLLRCPGSVQTSIRPGRWSRRPLSNWDRATHGTRLAAMDRRTPDRCMGGTNWSPPEQISWVATISPVGCWNRTDQLRAGNGKRTIEWLAAMARTRTYSMETFAKQLWESTRRVAPISSVTNRSIHPAVGRSRW